MARLIDAVYGIPAPATPRNDLVSVFLTGVDGLNMPDGVVPSEELRLNMSIDPCTSACSTLGVIGGDNAGFPNGRRLSDDVLDMALQVVEGVLVGQDTGLGDGVDANDKSFGGSFPYLALPHSGSSHRRTDHAGERRASRAAPHPPRRGSWMIRLRRSIGVAAVAATLFLVGGVGAWRSFRDAPVAAATTSADALVAPVAGASLEQTIADLQTRLQAQPDDARSLALLGLAYAQEATHTADPSYYPKAAEALQRSLELQPDGNVEALVGMGVVALARHDFAGGVRWGRLARQANPDAAHILGVIGDGQLELGHYQRAFATFHTMVSMRPDVASYARVSYARELVGDVPGGARDDAPGGRRGGNARRCGLGQLSDR